MLSSANQKRPPKSLHPTPRDGNDQKQVRVHCHRPVRAAAGLRLTEEHAKDSCIDEPQATAVTAHTNSSFQGFARHCSWMRKPRMLLNCTVALERQEQGSACIDNLASSARRQLVCTQRMQDAWQTYAAKTKATHHAIHALQAALLCWVLCCVLCCMLCWVLQYAWLAISVYLLLQRPLLLP